MSALHLQLLAGPTAGRRASFDPQDRVVFGRAEDCALALPEAYVSRHHGEFRFEDGRWVVRCLSPQTLRVNRRKVHGVSRPLRDGDVLSIGTRQVLRVALDPAPAAAAPGVAAAGPRRRMSGRARLWLGIGLYLLACAVVLGVLASVVGPPGSKPVVLEALRTAQQIREDVTRRPPAREQPDPARSAEALRQAREHFALRDRARANLYHAYRSFQDALAWSGADSFEDANDVLRFDEAERDLLERVERLYGDGANLLRSGQFREADRTFRDLITLYPDYASPLYQHVERQRSIARRHLGRRGLR